jgi:hypothetical protein
MYIKKKYIIIIVILIRIFELFWNIEFRIRNDLITFITDEAYLIFDKKKKL